MTLTMVVMAALAALSFALSVWQFVLALRFPLHRRSVPAGPAPGVSLLKPLRGCDAETRACLRSWLAQDYAGPVEILFGVDGDDDPACEVVRDLMKEHPRCPAQLVVCAERLGPNAKVSKLVQLARRTRHGILCVSDADVLVPPDFLGNAAAPLREERTGLVNCFYRLANPKGLAMRWEAFAVNADFWSQVLQATALKPMDFALGAVMVTTRRHLDAAGGFHALVDYLADDYELGKRIVRCGAQVVISPLVVDCRMAPQGFAEVWLHQLRWARTIRVCQPGPYFLSILGNTTLWPLAWAAAHPTRTVLAASGAMLAWRMMMGFLLEWRMTQRARIDSLGLALVKDLVQIALWVGAFTGREVVWRGQRLCVDSSGRLKHASTGSR